MPRVLIVAGETSGDLHGAHLARALQAQCPDVTLLGMGGKKMRAAGVEIILGIDRLDVVGQVGSNQIGAIVKNFLFLRRYLRSTSLDVVVFIDYPGFNLRMARIASGAGHRVVYYIAPQIWAWAPKRIDLIARVVHHVVVILPFEKKIYDNAKIPCTFVGHPLLDDIAPQYDRAGLRRRFEIVEGRRVVGLFPGSREREIRTLLPVMIDAASKLQQKYPDLLFVLAKVSSLPEGLVEELVAKAPVPIQVISDHPSEVMAISDFLLVASGTATLHAAIIGVPMVILYRGPWFTYMLAKHLIQIPWIGLVNIIGGRTICKELLQYQATADNLYEETTRLLDDPVAYQEMKVALREVRESLGEPGASRRAAEVILAECRS